LNGFDGFLGAEVLLGFTEVANETPLFQTNFVPDLTQVNFFVPTISVEFTFVHFAPAFGAGAADEGYNIIVESNERRGNKKNFFTSLPPPEQT
jgi:hypothetical protein